MQIILDPQGYQLLISHRRISSKQKKKFILLLLRGDTSVICLLLFSSVNFFPIPPPNPTFSPIPQRDLSYTTRMSTVKRAKHFARDAFRGSFRRPRGGFYLSARTRAARLCAGSSAGFQGRPWRKDRESFDCQHEETCVSHGGDVTRKTVSLNCVPTSVYTAFPLPSSSFNGSALSSALSAEQDAAYRRILSPTEAHLPLHRGAEIKEKRDGKLRA